MMKFVHRIPPRWRNEEGSDAGNSEFSFGIEINLAGTPAMDRLWEYISKHKQYHSDQIHTGLAGNISRSLHLDDTDNWFFDNVLLSVIAQYKEEYPTRYQEQNLTMTGCDHDIFSGNKNAPFGLCSFWVNFQRQHEFNPIHYHSGIYSFAIMMKIPYDWREQHELPHVKVSNSPSAGNFQFLYTDVFGHIKMLDYKLDPTCEGLMLFFPATTRHMVYPFYECEEERITIAGNLAYDI